MNKTKRSRKDYSLRIRMTLDQKKSMATAATRSGLDLSTWLRSVGVRVAAGVMEREKGT